MIPVVGWLMTLLIVCFGFGAFSVVTIERWTTKAPMMVAAAAPTTA